MPEGEEGFDESGTGACEAEGGHEKNEVESRAIGRRSRSARPKGSWPRVAVIRQLTPNIDHPPAKRAKQFPPLVKKVIIMGISPWQAVWEWKIDVPDGIIAHLTRECGGNVHESHVVDITSGSFKKETQGANPHSGAYNTLILKATEE
jgi:hypothetical protein